jgi:hypothetical protein
LRDRLQNISGAGDVRQIDFGLDFFVAASRARSGLTGGSRPFARRAQVRSNFLSFVLFQRTGVSFLLGHSDKRKRIENGFTLDFQFPGKIVDANLTHPAFHFSVL